MLNEHEIDRLQILLRDEFLLKTVEKVLTKAIQDSEPKVSEVNDDIQLGQKYRAYDTAKEILQSGFIALLNHKKVENPEDKLNKAR